MKIVFLKLADENGVSRKAVAALRLKYPAYRGGGVSSWFSRSSWSEWWTNDNQVREFSLIPLYGQWVSPRLSLDFLDAMVEVQQACANADKVLLGVHGEPGDTTTAHVDLFNVTQTITYQQLARFIYLFLPNTNETIKLSLIMCYGARATNPRLNHEGALSAMQVKSSFAYRFWKQLCQWQNVRLTARTGAVSFSEQDGRSLVQTEAAVAAQLDEQELQGSDDVTWLSGAYEQLKETTLARGGREAIRALLERENTIKQEIARGRTDWSMASGTDRILLEYNQVKNRIQQLSAAKNVDRGKYGKFVYSYDRPHAIATVTRKYPNPAVLYRGAL